MYWFPKSKIGRISFWLGVSAFILMFLQYWIAMLFQTSFILPGILVMVAIIASGVSAVIALIKHKDKAILLIIPLLIGLFGIFFVIGELVFPH